jgi:hypothetical protein
MNMRLYYLFLLLFIGACRTPKTNWNKECAERFPPRTDTFRVTTEIVKMDTTFQAIRVPYYVKTVCLPSDTVRIVQSQAFADCPPIQQIVKTRILHDSIVIYQANLAAENLLKSELDTADMLNLRLKRDIVSKNKSLRVAKWFAVLGWLLVALFIFGTLAIKRRNP